MRDKFLSSIVEYYKLRDFDSGRMVFVLPNKRSAMFMRTYFKRMYADRPVLMPSFVTLSSFVARMSRITEVSRTELLFCLYRCYLRIIGPYSDRVHIRSFDEFVFWGDLIVSDFSDIDANAADASMLFSNLERLRELESNYLTTEQTDAIEQLWGYRPPSSEEVEHFWKNIISLSHMREKHSEHDEGSENDEGHDNDDAGSLSSQFIFIWQILGELYPEFRKDLRARGIGYRGMVIEDAALSMKDMRKEDLEFSHYVFVGIGSTPENLRRIFRRLKTFGIADFFWDLPNIFEKAGKSQIRSAHDGAGTALRKVGEMAQEFPMPDDYTAPEGPSRPMFDIIGIPSDMMQAQLASRVIEKWKDDGSLGSSLDNTAIIMPDTALLPSLLNCLPDYPGGVNITMGLPMRQTPFATLIRTIISMHMRMRTLHGEPILYHEDITEVVSSPSIRRLDPEGCDKILRYLNDNRLYTVPVSQLQSTAPKISFIFNLPETGSEPAEARTYLSVLISCLCKATGYDPEDPKSAETTRAHEYHVLQAYHDAIAEIFDMAERYSVEIRENTCFRLVERLLMTDTLGMAGAPLRGLQVMGLLESRAIDFDNLIVLSVNERILPRKNPLKTLIPHTLRKAYHLPVIEDAESDSAYNFFRLLSRARRAAFIYDSRSSGVAAGEMSRYLLQMSRLLSPKVVHDSTCSLSASLSGERRISVAKDEDVLSLLNLYRAPENGVLTEDARYISASMLKVYLSCPLEFYLKHIRRLKDEDETSMFMDSATYGSIIHKVLEDILGRFTGRQVTEDNIRNILASDLSGFVTSVIDREYYRGRYRGNLDIMPGEGAVLSEVIEKIVRRSLENDIVNTPFFFLVAESGPQGPWEMAPGLRLNFKSKIDRVDMLSDGRLRFIDYKTGSDRFFFTSCENLFSKERKERNDAVFQLLLYCHATADMPVEYNPVLRKVQQIDPTVNRCSEIKPEIFRLKSVYVDKNTYIAVGSEKRHDIIESFNDEAVSDFRKHLAEKVSEIFNPDVPFFQTEDRENCTYCAFAQLCGRQSANR